MPPTAPFPQHLAPVNIPKIPYKNGSVFVEIPGSALMPTGVFVLSVSGMFLISALGSVCNMHLFRKFVTRKANSNGFQKICLIKTVTNTVLCFSFLLWVCPVTSMSLVYSDLNYYVNRGVGLISTTWSYFLNSLLQMCLSFNRLYVLYFPFGVKQLRHLNMTKWAIITSVVLVSVFSATTIPEGCGYVYDPTYYLWRPEVSECADFLAVFSPPIIFGVAIISNACNVAIVLRLLMSKMAGMSKEDSKRRRRRWMGAFVQSTIQDCIQLIDNLNSFYIYKLSDSLWFQFIFVTLSLSTVPTLDGIVMLVCNADTHPKWFQKKRGESKTPMAVAALVHNSLSQN